MSDLLKDLRFAVRSLRRNPGFTAAAVATLALGIGANAAIFSLVRGVLLRPLPFPEPDRLVSVRESHEKYGPMVASPPNYLDFKAQSRLFQSMGAFATSSLVLSGAGEAEQLAGTFVTSGFFESLGIRPLQGRTLEPAETETPGARVVVLGHGVWARRFGSDPTIVGRSIRLNGEPYTVVGVMPASFRLPESGSDFWAPLAFEPGIEKQRGAHYLDIVARLKPGVSVEAANAELRGIAGRLRDLYPLTNRAYTAAVTSLATALVGAAAPAMKLLLGAVALVTLVACANVGNLLLVRGTRRRSEIAIRTALGASRRRIARQLLTEAALLAAVGAAAGLTLAAGSLDLILKLAPGDVPRLSEVRLDGGVLAFTALWAIVSVALFGLAPAFHALRTAPATALRGYGSDATSTRSAVGPRQLFVVAQIAMALVLSAGAGLLLRSLSRLSAVDPGFRTEQAVAFELTLPESRYADEEARAGFLARLLESLRAQAGVRNAGAVFGFPLTGMSFSSSFRETGTPPSETEPSAQLRLASRDYFATMGIPVIAGRGFSPSDRRGAPIAILVSESAAKKFFPHGNALGQRLRFGARATETRIEGEVVGVVADVKDEELGRGRRPSFTEVSSRPPPTCFTSSSGASAILARCRPPPEPPFGRSTPSSP